MLSKTQGTQCPKTLEKDVTLLSDWGSWKSSVALPSLNFMNGADKE
jgi:hypothetical protein